MADTPPVNAAFVGQLLLELPADSWLPEGYTLFPTTSPGGRVSVPIDVTDPSGHSRWAYPDPTFSAPAPRRESILQTIRRELGPIPTDGFWSPAQREWLGMNRPDVVGTVDRAFYGTADGVAWLYDLAGYGISASILATTEGLHRSGAMSQEGADRLRHNPRLHPAFGADDQRA